MVAGSVKRLMQMNNSLCHYCGEKTVIHETNRKRYPTKDHVVPRSFGGRNHISNYVLACARCNNRRGTSLFYCKCRPCQELIYDAIYNPDTINTIFAGIQRHNKPRIHKVDYTSPKGQWKVTIGHNSRLFHTFERALEFARSGSCVEDKEYS